jgi:hypothetical protein
MTVWRAMSKNSIAHGAESIVLITPSPTLPSVRGRERVGGYALRSMPFAI